MSVGSVYWRDIGNFDSIYRHRFGWFVDGGVWPRPLCSRSVDGLSGGRDRIDRCEYFYG